MAHATKNRSPQSNMQVLHDPRKMHGGSPRLAPTCNKPVQSNMTKGANGTRTGDAVSDESENADQDGDRNTPDDDEDSDDEADAFALSGARGPGSNGQRLAGHNRKTREEMIDEEDAIAGAIDDDDYGDVEDISESEDDESGEKTILKSAERELIAEYESQERPQTANSMSNGMTGLTLADVFSEDLDFDQDPFAGLATNDSLYDEMIAEAEAGFEDKLASWRIPEATLDLLARENSVQSNGNEKKVRFAETVSSRSSSISSEEEDEEDPRDTFPDLLDGLDDPMTRSQFLLDSEMAIDDDDNASEWDFDFADHDEKVAFQIDEESSDSDTSISDSEDDDGDTTDEEDVETYRARVLASRARLTANHGSVTPANTPASTPTSPVSSRKPSRARLSKAGRSGGRPMSGTFEHDPTKAQVKAEVNGSGVRLICPTKPSEIDSAFYERARQAMGSRDGSPNGATSWTRVTPRHEIIPQALRPFTAKSTLGTMFDGNLDFLRHNDDSGIAKEFLQQPARNTSTRSSFASSNTMEDDSENGDESDVDMGEYVHGMEESESEADEGPPSAAVLSPTSDSFPDFVYDSSPMQQLATGSATLDHLAQSSVPVSSFRTNQHHARQLSSLPAHPAKRAQTAEANALQKGRRAAANTPMTPARKNRASQDLSRTGAGVSKASASPLVQKHRRSRGNSLSQTLSLDHFADTRNH